MSDESSEQQALDTLRQIIGTGVRAGFTPPDELVEDAIEAAGDEAPDLSDEFLKTQGAAILAEAVAELREAQKSWPVVTDFDRLQRAFDRLEQAGIVCRHNFSCCGTCASGEIWDEIRGEQDAGRTIRGAAHYNVQDTEGAVEYGGLYFSYASVAEGKAALIEIGHEIVAAMKHEGLAADWNGDTGKRVHIEMDWKRRIVST